MLQEPLWAGPDLPGRTPAVHHRATAQDDNPCGTGQQQQGELPSETGGPRGRVTGSILRWTQTSLRADHKQPLSPTPQHTELPSETGVGEG